VTVYRLEGGCHHVSFGRSTVSVNTDGNNTLPRHLDPSHVDDFVLSRAAAIGLVPSIIDLAHSLPRHYDTGHWRELWVGFDVLEVHSGSLSIRASAPVCDQVADGHSDLNIRHVCRHHGHHLGRRTRWFGPPALVPHR
jgi:hypothetical protein